MKKILCLSAALAIVLPALMRADSAPQPLRDGVQLTAARTGALTNTFADGACTLDRVEARVDSPATGTLTLRHIWAAGGVTATNSWTAAYTNTAALQLEVTNAWPVLQNDIIQADLGVAATGAVWFGRSKIIAYPAR